MPDDRRLMKVISPEPHTWSLDNGISRQNYRPGVVYEVPRFVAEGMEARGWAKIITDEEIETQDAAETEISMTELRKSETPKGKE